MRKIYLLVFVLISFSTVVRAQFTIQGTVIDPKNDVNAPGDVTIQNGKIVEAPKPGAGSQNTGPDALFLVNPGSNDTRITNRKFEQVPSVVASADGKQLFVAWYSGGDAPGPGNFVTVSVSTDNGKTWKNDEFVIYPRSLTTRFFDPGLWRDKFGQVHLFYGSSKNNLLWDGKGGVNTVNLRWDGVKIAYNDPQRIADGVMSNKPVYVAADDKTLVSLYIDKPASAGSDFPPNGAFILSHDYKSGGRGINNLSPYSSVKVPDAIRIHDEPQLVQVSDKEFLCLVRTTNGIYYSRSLDKGKSWSDVAPFTAAGPTTSARFYIGKLKSGNLFMVLNSSTTRNNMTALLSKDGGKTWPYKLMLDARENVSYPDADQTADGNIHVVFDRDRTGAKDILYCRFNENDIMKGLQQNVFKSRVNK
jgi:Neuraminidase (sialidase)